MPKRARKQDGRSKVTATQRVVYKYEVSIAAHVSGAGANVPVTAFAGDKRRHGVFNLAREVDFAKRYAELAAASDAFYEYTYVDQQPTLRDVAMDFVNDRLGKDWTISSYVASCWTTSGWRPPQVPEVGCGSYGLVYKGTLLQVRMNCFSAGALNLRFAVTVHQTNP